jgi:hypothetical protein
MLDTETLVPLADAAGIGLGVGRRTLGRRIKSPPPGFPTVLRINNRLYVRRSELEAYKSRLISEAAIAPSGAQAMTG